MVAGHRCRDMGAQAEVAGQRCRGASAQTEPNEAGAKTLDWSSGASAPSRSPMPGNLTARAELLYRLTVEELKEMLRCRGLHTSGLKDDLVERLLQTGAAGSDAQAG